MCELVSLEFLLGLFVNFGQSLGSSVFLSKFLPI